MSPTQADPTGAEAMAGDSSSMATPSSDERGAQGQPAVPGSPDGRIGLEVVSASGGGGLQHAQGHQEVDRVGSSWTTSGVWAYGFDWDGGGEPFLE